MRVADYVFEYLYQYGIKSVFSVTGRGVLYLTDALAKSSIENISMHNEQAASYAAYGYAKSSHNMGVCLTSTGCASTNAITGCLCAWQDDIPCIFISGQNVLNNTVRHTRLDIRTFGQQEADIIDIVKPITKYAVMIDSPNKIIEELNRAVRIANEGRKGPVWIDIPLDIQNGRLPLKHLPKIIIEQKAEYKCEIEDVKYVCNLLNESERPIILFGSGIYSSNAENNLRKLCEKINVPVVFDSAAVDIMPDEHFLSIGTIGAIGGSRAGNFAIQNSDLVLSIGCRLTSMQVGDNPNLFARHAKKIIIDIDEHEKDKNTVAYDYYINSDAKYFLEMLLSECDTTVKQEWVDKCLHWKAIFPKCEIDRKYSNNIDIYHLSDVIGDLSDSKDIFVCDAGIEEIVVPSVVCKKQGTRCIHPVSQGAMGFALAAACGAYFASSSRVVVVVGDGSIMMNLQELQTISYYGVNAKVIVINNNGYAVIRKRQRDLFRNRTIGTDSDNGVSCPDFEKIAYAFNLHYVKIDNTNELVPKLQKVYDYDGAVLCEVMGLNDQTYLHNSFAIGENNRMIRRSLEDQSPFLDRELIKKEMIVDYLG